MGEMKDKLKGVKDKVLGAGEEAKDTVTGHDEDRYSTGAGQKDDPLTSYRDKEPMTPAKIKEHEPTAVKREMTEKIGQSGTNADEERHGQRYCWRRRDWQRIRTRFSWNKQIVNPNPKPNSKFPFSKKTVRDITAVCFPSLAVSSLYNQSILR
jgi:hypothetical protein